MKKFGIGLWLVMALLFAAFPLPGQAGENGDRTLSPYFLVRGEDTGADPLPLKSTSVEANISGVIADVAVTQVYENRGRKTIEAVYVFPASTRAAVYGMKMTIGERTITASIDRREAARRQYAQARDQGRSASLLEQHRPNVFQMHVANILPGDVIRVELRYTELIVPEDGTYTFVYPTVVGPRYTGASAGAERPAETWTANPYLHEGEPPTYEFHAAVRLAAGLPIREVSCASHRMNTRFLGPAVAHLELDPLETRGGNRDLILKYRLAGNQIQTGLLLLEGEKENFFMLMMQPPERVAARQIPPREYIFIVDVSGSMHGFPLDISKRLLKDLIGNLRPEDRFNVLLFAGASTVMADRSLPATSENVARALTLIDRQRGGGGTELLPALKRALALPRGEGCSRSVVIATDGYVSLEEEAFDLIRGSLGEANLFAFGIGSSVNRHLIEGMARAGMGEPFVIARPEEAEAGAAKFRRLIQSPVLTGIKVDFGRFQAYDVEPPAIPDVLAERPVLVFGKWKGRPEGIIRVTGRGGEGLYEQSLDAGRFRPEKENAALRYLWARHRIALLSDYNLLRSTDRRVEEVTQLGLTYGLLTAYTSFVAVDSVKRADGGQPVVVRQPLPLPQGVSDHAVGRSMTAAKAPQVQALYRTTADREKERGPVLEEKGGKAERDEARSAGETASIRMALAGVSCSGELSLDEVRRVIEKALESARRCVAEGGPGQGAGAGQLAFRLRIDPDGKVKEALFTAGGDQAGPAAQCLLRAFKECRFSRPSGAQTARIDLTVAVS